MGVGECQSVDSFVFFGAKLTQRACARDFLRDRKKKESKVSGQGIEESCQHKSGEGFGQRKAAAK